jgi:hypothetical protein
MTGSHLKWFVDRDGNWFVGNAADLRGTKNISEEEKKKCVMLDFEDLKKISFGTSPVCKRPKIALTRKHISEIRLLRSWGFSLQKGVTTASGASGRYSGALRGL